MTIERQRPPQFYTVPPGTEGKPCRVKECGATLYLIPSPKNKGTWIPVDCGVVGGQTPSGLEHGVGVNHYTTCVDPARFRKPREETPPPRTPQRELAVGHRPRACIFCGCTEQRACRYVPTAEEMLQRADAERLHELEQLGETPAGVDTAWLQEVSCYWLQLDPPICSAPGCVEKRKDLPLRMKVGGTR